MNGVLQVVRDIEPKVQAAGCIWIHQVRNKISIHMQFISMLIMEQIIDTNEIFQNEMFENFPEHGSNGMETDSMREPK